VSNSGNVRPVRLLTGAATGITRPGLIGTDKIALSSDGRLFVAEPNNRILVFAPGARGNVAPSQVIQDSSIGSTQVREAELGPAPPAVDKHRSSFSTRRSAVDSRTAPGWSKKPTSQCN